MMRTTLYEAAQIMLMKGPSAASGEKHEPARDTLGAAKRHKTTAGEINPFA